MANLWWITVTLTFFLSAGCLAQVDQNRLVALIQQIRNIATQNDINGVYGVAVSMPGDDPYNPQSVPQLTKENIDLIRENGVYRSARLVFSLKLKNVPRHAEVLLLRDLHLENQDGDMLVIFGSDSPCDKRCADPHSPYTIVGNLKAAVEGGRWGNHVFVFEKVFKPRAGSNIDEGKLKTALQNIGNSIGGLANVFRCYYPQARTGFTCVSCSDNGEVAQVCVDYDA